MDSNVTPEISVLMPVYNCSNYIYDSIFSILNQTFSNFELIIIDDCSTDNTVDIIKNINDQRIKLIEKQQNTGCTKSLNFALKFATGKYIARMDGDDISFSDRLEKQYQFMEANSDVILCGGGYEVINSDKKFIPYLSHEELLFDMINHCPFAHPTIMIRNEILKKNQINYDPNFEPAEDYEMWTRLSEYGKIANIPDKLIKYRIHEQQTTNLRALQQSEITRKISLNHVKKISSNNIYSDYFINYKIHSFSDYKKYNDVENDIQKYFNNNNFKLNLKLLKTRKKNYLIHALSNDNFNIFLLFKKLPLFLSIWNIVGLGFLLKYAFKSIICWKSIKFI
jgi:glycosyltransferase involved in cell wall biosynthesis